MFCIPSLYEVGRCNSDSYEIVGMSNSGTITHKEAERQRRKRINAHIATLKSILPNTIKTDKASLLGEAVRRIKELKRTAADQEYWAPSETDQMKVWRCHNTGLIKAAVSCDDRPEMTVEIIEALKAAEAKVVRAEMSTVGGRTKTLLWLRLINDVGLDKLTRALKMLMDQLPSNKRSRYYHHF